MIGNRRAGPVPPVWRSDGDRRTGRQPGGGTRLGYGVGIRGGGPVLARRGSGFGGRTTGVTGTRNRPVAGSPHVDTPWGMFGVWDSTVRHRFAYRDRCWDPSVRCWRWWHIPT